MARQVSSLEQLTWEDLTSWAGSKILSRGKSYKRQVSDVRRTHDGGILAWVQGTKRYVTLVKRESSGTLSSTCSCPYGWSPCKHSVALVLAYLDSVKKNEEVPEVSKADKRLKLLAEASTQGISDSPWEMDRDDETDEDFQDSGQDQGEKLPAALARSRQSRTRKSKQADVVRQRIESMGRDELVEFVINLIQEYPDVGRKIEEEEELKSGRVTKIIRDIRVEIENLTSEPAWANYWSGESNIPDYSRVRERMQSLLDSGHADEVLALGKDLWRLGNEQVGSSDDEGETGAQISECMEVVLQAATKSSLSIRDQILWIIDTHLSDDYGLLEGSEKCLADLKDKKSWSEVADSMLQRLASMPAIHKETDFSKGYRRQRIMKSAIDALKRCGRSKEIIPLLEREAPITQCYGTLVEHLVAAARRSEARVVAMDGFLQTIDDAPGIAWDLEAKLRMMAEHDKDLPLIASYRALEFFDRPSLDSYKTLKKAAEASGHWAAVRDAAVEFLETGSRPDLEGSAAGSNIKKKGTGLWPLPSTGLPNTSRNTPRGHFPDNSALIRIAIYEKDTDEIIRRYNLAKSSRIFGGSVLDEVAEAVKKWHPDVSLEIWKNLAEEQIRIVKPAAYEVAARYLRKMRDIFQKSNRTAEWTTLIRGIRAVHKPKRSLMQILDTLEGKRIVDT